MDSKQRLAIQDLASTAAALSRTSSKSVRDQAFRLFDHYRNVYGTRLSAAINRQIGSYRVKILQGGVSATGLKAGLAYLSGAIKKATPAPPPTETMWPPPIAVTPGMFGLEDLGDLQSVPKKLLLLIGALAVFKWVRR